MANKPGLLVTGATGFVGRHLIALGRSRFDIVATGLGPKPDWLPENVAWHAADLLDRISVSTLPDDLPFVIHLASETVPAKFANYDPLLDSVEMTLNLCRHLRSGRLLFASSCLVYGASGATMSEDAPLAPRGHYGLAKQLCETIVLRAASGGGIAPAVARPFNHIGTGMRPDLVIPSIVRRVREAREGAPIQMAGLDSVRDFLDVTDIVEGYFAILGLRSEERIFNVASGVPTSIGDIVRIVADILGKSIGEVVFADQGNSADDSSIVVGDSRKLRDAAGWAPHVTLRESLRRLIEDLPVQ